MSAGSSAGRVERAYLFVPGDRPERFDKAAAAGAPALILDLEDAVPAERKTQAREHVAAWLAQRSAAMGAASAAGGQGGGPAIYVRVNAAGTPYLDDDLAACRHPALAGIVLPKTERPDDLRHARSILGESAALLPLIETAVGIANATELAGQPGVRRLVFGSIDFQLDLGIEGEGEELLFFRSQLVLSSRLAGAQAPVDGVTTALDDPQFLYDETRRSRRLGFGAKLCIHPKQVEPVLRAFRPTEEEIAWARRVVEAERAAAGAAVALDGKMVDRPVILKAHEILAAA